MLPESDSNGELGYNQPYPWNLVLQGRDRNEVNRLMELARTDPETFNHLIRVLDANGDRLKLVKTDNGYLQNDGSIKAWGSINSVQILNPTVPAKINTEEWDLSFGELP